MSGIEKYEYTGEPTLKNEAYKIYLSKQYNIEKIETINKFQCQGKTFENAQEALRYAQSIDRGIALEYLEKDDPLLTDSVEKSIKEDVSVENKTSSSEKIYINSKSNTVTKSTGGSGFVIAMLAITSMIGLFYFASKFDSTPATTLQSLESRQDISKYTIDGELAEAFNLNSKNTDIQRDNLLKEIKGKLVVWEVEIYEIKKQSNNLYKIQTSGGINLVKGDVGTFIELTSKDENESKFIEGLKTGQVIRIKGILTGDSVLRSLIIKPAILWYPDEKKNKNDQSINSSSGENHSMLDGDKFKNLVGKKSSEAFDDPTFILLFNSITKPNEREQIKMAGWEDYEIVQKGNYIIGQGELPHSAGWGLCGGGLFVLDTAKNNLNVHICNQAEVFSYGKDISIEFINRNYPSEAKSWLCETYDKQFRLSIICK